ncbi:hypothetical protein ACCS64_38335, partial [Rhizobium ruizarguesonis]
SPALEASGSTDCGLRRNGSAPRRPWQKRRAPKIEVRKNAIVFTAKVPGVMRVKAQEPGSRGAHGWVIL